MGEGNTDNLKHSKRLGTALLIFGASALGVGVLQAPQAAMGMAQRAESPPTAQSQAKTVIIPIEGMSCMSCAATIRKGLKDVVGVKEVDVSLERREARIQYDERQVTTKRLAAVINDLGYKAGTPTAPSVP